MIAPGEGSPLPPGPVTRRAPLPEHPGASLMIMPTRLLANDERLMWTPLPLTYMVSDPSCTLNQVLSSSRRSHVLTSSL